MYLATFAVLAQVILVCIIPIFTGEAAQTDEDGNVEVSRGDIFGIALSGVRYLIMIFLYGGFTAVIMGVYMMEPPEEVWVRVSCSHCRGLYCLLIHTGFEQVAVQSGQVNLPTSWRSNLPSRYFGSSLFAGLI